MCGSFTGLSSVHPCLLYCEAQNWTQVSRWDLTSAEKRKRITSLELLTEVFPVHPRILLITFAINSYHWLMENLVSNGTPRSITAKLLSRRGVSSIYCLWNGAWNLCTIRVVLKLSSESAIITFWIIAATSLRQVLGEIPLVLLQKKPQNLLVRILLSQ